jgi:hypothetical protein
VTKAKGLWQAGEPHRRFVRDARLGRTLTDAQMRERRLARARFHARNVNARKTAERRRLGISCAEQMERKRRYRDGHRERLRRRAAGTGKSQVEASFREHDYHECSCTGLVLRDDAPRIRGIQFRCRRICPLATEEERHARADGRWCDAWPRLPKEYQRH